MFRYCGEYFDKETGTIYLRARYYDPETGRFITEDSYSGKDSDPLSLNLYIYVDNNPVNLFDPSGHIPTAMEAMNMANYIYSQSGTLSGGWNFDHAITGGDNMVMGVFYRVKKDGTTEYGLVDKGTTPTDISDWKNDIQQPLGSSADMKASIADAEEFVKNNSGSEITMVGHSKGGSEAAANAVATNTNCIIFNPATVNLNAYRLDSSRYHASMTAFIVKGEILNNTFGSVSKPIGKVVYLPNQHMTPWWVQGPARNALNVYNEIQNHLMPSVKSALKEAGYN